MELEFIIYEREPDDIGILTINRPRVLNAINLQTLRELRTFLEDILPKEYLRTLIITGANAGSEMDLQKALLLEKILVSLCFDTEDRVEGMKASLEKREPSFKGK